MHPDKHNNRPCATELFQDLNTKYANKCSDKDDKGEKGVEGDDTIKQDIELSELEGNIVNIQFFGVGGSSKLYQKVTLTLKNKKLL